MCFVLCTLLTSCKSKHIWCKKPRKAESYLKENAWRYLISECSQGLVYWMHKYYIGHIMFSKFSWHSLHLTIYCYKPSYFNRLTGEHKLHNLCHLAAFLYEVTDKEVGKWQKGEFYVSLHVCLLKFEICNSNANYCKLFQLMQTIPTNVWKHNVSSIVFMHSVN